MALGIRRMRGILLLRSRRMSRACVVLSRCKRPSKTRRLEKEHAFCSADQEEYGRKKTKVKITLFSSSYMCQVRGRSGVQKLDITSTQRKLVVIHDNKHKTRRPSSLPHSMYYNIQHSEPSPKTAAFIQELRHVQHQRMSETVIFLQTLFIATAKKASITSRPSCTSYVYWLHQATRKND